MSDTILVTGATGFLGSHLVARLIAAGSRVIALKRSGSNLARLAPCLGALRLLDVERGGISEAFEDSPPSVVVHCATLYGRGGEPPDALVDANVCFPVKLLEAAQRAGVRTFLNVDTALPPEVSPYALSKAQFRAWLHRTADSVCAVNVALEHFYGPGDDPSKFISGLVRELLSGAQRVPLTAGEQRRNFVHVSDAVEALIMLLEWARSANVGYHAFQVGTDETVTIRSVVELLRELAGAVSTKLDFGAVPYRKNELMQSDVDARALRALGWRPRVSLREGLSQLVEIEKGGAAR